MIQAVYAGNIITCTTINKEKQMRITHLRTIVRYGIMKENVEVHNHEATKSGKKQENKDTSRE